MKNNLETVVKNKITQGTPIKLHLGCGPNILDGYVNVEGSYYQGDGDVCIHDITNTLPIPDNSVEEILTVHVIEHIMPNEVPAMLTDWLRVLKPKGKVAVEWPDLYKMCKFLVDDPTRFYTKNGKMLKRGVAGIFGNIGRYKDVAMLHKWGYSADSMKFLLNEVGFKNVTVEPNLYPKTEMCSRVVGYKL